jgi:tetratricopeptide (TPR) repeat protein
LLEEGRLKAAAEAYRAALRIEPRDAEALNNLGLVYSAAGLFDQAAEQLRAALEIEPRYPEAAYNLGLAYRALGRPRAAAEMFAVALELAPDLDPAREQLSQLGIDGAVIETGAPDAGPEPAGVADGGPAGDQD